VTTIDETTARLGNVGHRLTGPRLAVLDAVTAASGPFTAEEICDALPDVGRATVFRTMKLLQELDIVCRVPLEDGSVRYQVSHGGHHHHLICGECGSVSEFNDPTLDALIHENATLQRFKLASHSLELYGRCAGCATGG
jgi:Fur family transcriptional regulator, ferric uptake regulator